MNTGFVKDHVRAGRRPGYRCPGQHVQVVQPIAIEFHREVARSIQGEIDHPVPGCGFRRVLRRTELDTAKVTIVLLNRNLDFAAKIELYDAGGTMRILIDVNAIFV